MTQGEVSAALRCLGHPRRLDAFALLATAGSAGLLAGEIADRLGAKPNTMSTNLAVLLRVGLVRARREGRAVRYTADMETVGGLLTWLARACPIDGCDARGAATADAVGAAAPTDPCEGA